VGYSDSQISAYFARIGAGEAGSSLGALNEIHRAHRLAIPFENLDIPLGAGIDLGSEQLFNKLVTGRRGGYCFEQNALFLGMLQALGFEARPLLARIWLRTAPDDPVPPRTHTLNLVQVDGADYIADAGFGIEDMTGRLDIGSAFAPLPIASLDVTDVSARFVDGQCAAAEGNVRAGVAGEVAGFALPGGLSGNARCDEGALLLPLVSQTGMEALNLRLFESGRYEVELAVRPLDDTMRDRLIGAGFLLSSNGYVLRSSGEF